MEAVEAGGRFTTTPTKARRAWAMSDTRRHALQEIADPFDVVRGTVYRRPESGTAD